MAFQQAPPIAAEAGRDERRPIRTGFGGMRRPSPRQMTGLGVASACALGLAFGLWARPELKDDLRDRAPMQPAAQTPAADSGEMEIVVNAPPPPSPVAPVAQVGKLDVLPADMARAAAPPAPVRVTRPAPSAPAPRVAVAPAAPAVRASFDCGSADGLAEQMVCRDAALAARDRRLAQAYRRALDAGASARDLRAEQGDWVAIREEAARWSPDAVADVYDQRIAELNAMADGW